MERKSKKKKQQKKSLVAQSKNGRHKRKIPKECFENALRVINDPNDDAWKERSTACEKYIHRNEESKTYISTPSDPFHWKLQMRLARECLMRRDWNSLTEILLLYKPTKENYYHFPIFAKYASMCLAYSDQPLLSTLVNSFKCNQPIEEVLKKWTELPKSRDTESDAPLES